MAYSFNIREIHNQAGQAARIQVGNPGSPAVSLAQLDSYTDDWQNIYGVAASFDPALQGIFVFLKDSNGSNCLLKINPESGALITKMDDVFGDWPQSAPQPTHAEGYRIYNAYAFSDAAQVQQNGLVFLAPEFGANEVKLRVFKQSNSPEFVTLLVNLPVIDGNPALPWSWENAAYIVSMEEFVYVMFQKTDTEGVNHSNVFRLDLAACFSAPTELQDMEPMPFHAAPNPVTAMAGHLDQFFYTDVATPGDLYIRKIDGQNEKTISLGAAQACSNFHHQATRLFDTSDQTTYSGAFLYLMEANPTIAPTFSYQLKIRPIGEYREEDIELELTSNIAPPFSDILGAFRGMTVNPFTGMIYFLNGLDIFRVNPTLGAQIRVPAHSALLLPTANVPIPQDGSGTVQVQVSVAATTNQAPDSNPVSADLSFRQDPVAFLKDGQVLLPLPNMGPYAGDEMVDVRLVLDDSGGNVIITMIDIDPGHLHIELYSAATQAGSSN